MIWGKNMDEHNFGWALKQLWLGHTVARSGWNGRGIFIKMKFPDQTSDMSAPYIYIDTTGLDSDNPDAPRCTVPWLASQTDMIADDYDTVR